MKVMPKGLGSGLRLRQATTDQCNYCRIGVANDWLLHCCSSDRVAMIHDLQTGLLVPLPMVQNERDHMWFRIGGRGRRKGRREGGNRWREHRPQLLAAGHCSITATTLTWLCRSSCARFNASRCLWSFIALSVNTCTVVRGNTGRKLQKSMYGSCLVQ